MNHARALGRLALALVAAAALHTGSANAVCWELGLQVQNQDGSLADQTIYVYERDTCTFKGTWSTQTGSDGVNLRIDFNGNCPGMPNLEPDVVYVLWFKEWHRFAYVQGSLEGPGPFDDIWIVRKPDFVQHVLGPMEQYVWGFPDAECSSSGPLTVDLEVYDTAENGNHTTFFLRALADGGSGSYAFSWSNATPTGTRTDNPNYGVRTLLNGQSAYVTVTVNGTASDQTLLETVFDPLFAREGDPEREASWGKIKSLYR